MSRRLGRLLRPTGRLFLGSIVLTIAALLLSLELLRSESSILPGDRFDAVVVLGGGDPDRAQRAAQLFVSKTAPRVLVTGTNDCLVNRAILVSADVPENAIEIECEARTTRENALFATRLLRRSQARQVVLVTSWYHSRRALACFRRIAPEIEFCSAPSHEHMGRWPDGWSDDARKRLLEYLKIAVYALWWRIPPW